MNKNNSKIPKNDSELFKKDEEISYEIVGNENDKKEQILPEKRNKNKQLSVPIFEIPVKMIIGNPKKVRSTCARIIKLGAKGRIPQQLVNSLIWQLRSLVYFDEKIAELTYLDRLEAVERELRKLDKS